MQNANRGDGRLALTMAQRLSRYQSLRMDLIKSTGRLFAIPAARSWIYRKHEQMD
jgi:hypothetical protein